MTKILIIEDDQETAEFISQVLKSAEFDVIHSYVGKDVVKKILLYSPDLILLDLTLPDCDGIDLCREIKADFRFQTIPVIMLTARSSTEDKLIGFECGADDYIVKPFEPRELLVRIKALLRRVEIFGGKPHEVITIGPLTIDVDSYTVTVLQPQRIELTPKEFQLLYLLMKNQNRVLDRKFLLKTLWGYSDEQEMEKTRTLDVHVMNLRKKLGEEIGKYIKTVENIGYKFEYTE
ncbi:MAG: response regulator transcription factor [Endomicrobia bacterium]|nr:response regulator transcription factor [Endomicrobiia bacterium]MCX7940164.1 response regulator transcription factor [Endomicrobiia bacterium]MDW8055684.1 response regulator transcription factor [Elusimicrobiota bacterium]